MELRAIYPYTRSKVSNIIARQGCSNTFDSSAFFLLRSSNNKAKATVPMNRLYSSKREFCLAASARTGDIFGYTFGNKTNISKASFANLSKYPSGRIETKKGFYINQLCKYATATLKKDTPSAGSGGSSGHSGTSSGGLKLKCSEFDKDGNLTNLSAEEEILVNLVQSLLLYLEESIDRTKLKELLQYSKRLSKFEQKVENIRKALDEVLEQDEDLAAMYLTNVYNYGQPQDVDSHQEIEYLLETYLMQVEEISANIDSVLSQLKTTEEIANIILDSQRNSLLLLEIRLTILAVGVGLGTFVSSLFGMNLLSGYEEHSTAFILVCTVAFVLSFFTVGYAFLRMNKMLRKMF
ncbi:Mitochondrial inner membrane magnesium transporter mrs2 [Zancudomyces culisetae]|uniref:Magnesium transporter n=1 Tax=Zancudomyces culisetae TaxID=1213189 RepID=A0A1R1PCB2_ZANCU|nr:Mitochondrial inner membrane magnesium transporter mrs2 [Zancudomyces culisetae]|eukprot:OMH78608.1 Mitochondrial inner membrane magnesium transporter mrs2 [Zancudomyces culisetae]